MKLMRYGLVVIILSITKLLVAQTKEDQVIFNAMRDEMKRSMQLKTEGKESPFLIQYYYIRSKKMDVDASLGAVLTSSETPVNAVGGIRLLLGDYKRNTEEILNSRTVNGFPMPIDVDYDVIREKYWFYSDMAYKMAVMIQAHKKQMEKLKPKEELELAELMPISPIEKIQHLDTLLILDREACEKKVSEISTVFEEFSDLFNSTVSINGKIEDYYLVSSEGVTIKKQMQSLVLSASVSGMTKEGRIIMEGYSTSAKSLDAFPPIDTIKKQLRRVAENLEKFKSAESFKKYYSGPVLFEGGGASALFAQFTNNVLISPKRFAIGEGASASELPLAERFTKKVTDGRLTVKNYTTLKEYKGKKLTGHYEVDAEGVVPPAELTLVENGFLKGFLNDRIPRQNFEQTTGSSNYYMFNNRIYNKIEPGVLHFQVTKGCKPKELKKKLLKAAKKERLETAYIVRRADGIFPLVYEVDVKTGKEKQVVDVSVSLPTGFGRRDFRVIDFSNKEIITGKMIYPSGVLLESCELSRIEKRNENLPPLSLPLTKSVTGNQE